MLKNNGVSNKTKNNWMLDAGLFLTALVAILTGVYYLIVPSGGYQGGRNPWYGVTVLFARDTWDWLHTWIGLAMVVIALIHIILHWKWVVNMTKRMLSAIKGGGSNLNARGKYNLAINTTIGLSFLICAISGVYFLLAGSSEGGRNPDPMFLFTREIWDILHTWSSILFISAGLLHFVIHWGWITKVTRKVFGFASPVAAQDSNYEPVRKGMAMFKKIAGTAALVIVVGLLAFGGVKRTYAESETAAEEIALVGYATNGNGFGGDTEPSNSEVLPGSGEQVFSLASLPIGTLNQAEKDALLFMYEEEKLARDIYSVFADLWGKNMFYNIASAEQIHMDSIAELLERYNLTIPGTVESGVYVNIDLQALYNTLTLKGSESLANALLVGGAVEEIDILDLKERLLQTDQTDIQTVFENLLKGSYNHLNSFSAVYKADTGLTYVPQYMTQANFDAIVVLGTQTGSGKGNGLGGGGNGRR